MGAFLIVQLSLPQLYCLVCWCMYNVQELLEKLFDWASEGAMPTKKSQPPRKRDVVLICGGTGWVGVPTVSTLVPCQEQSIIERLTLPTCAWVRYITRGQRKPLSPFLHRSIGLRISHRNTFNGEGGLRQAASKSHEPICHSGRVGSLSVIVMAIKSTAK